MKSKLWSYLCFNMDVKSAWFCRCYSRKEMKIWFYKIDTIYDNITEIPELQKRQWNLPSPDTALNCCERKLSVLSLIILILLSNFLHTTCLWITYSLWHRRWYSNKVFFFIIFKDDIYGLTLWLWSSKYIL